MASLLAYIMACQDRVTKEASEAENLTSNYWQNRVPITEKPYLALPLGNIKPKGWLGSDGDGWEQGPLVYALKTRGGSIS